MKGGIWGEGGFFVPLTEWKNKKLGRLSRPTLWPEKKGREPCLPRGLERKGKKAKT